MMKMLSLMPAWWAWNAGRAKRPPASIVQVWMPDQKVALNNVLWPYPPNIYSPRGSLWRDPREWRTATQMLRDLQPEILIGQPTPALKGKDQIFQHLNNYIDFSNLMLDQTLRGMLKGLGPEDLIDFVQLPEHLQKDPYLAEIYGLFCWYPPYIAQFALGWWDGDAATLFRLPRREIALRLVPLCATTHANTAGPSTPA